MEPLKKNIKCKIINENNEIKKKKKGIELKKDDNYKYVSLFKYNTMSTFKCEY